MKKIFIPILLLLLSCQTEMNNQRKEEYNKLLAQKLSTAIQTGNTREVKSLLKTGRINLNPEPKENINNNPLITAVHYSGMRNNREIVEILLSNGADINGQNYDGATTLYTALLHNNRELAEDLLKQGADPNIPNDDGNTAISYLCSTGNMKLIKLALEKGALINESHIKWNASGPQDEKAWNYTAFQWAVMKNRYEAVELLLEWGGNPSISVRGMNSFMMAEKYGYTKILELLNEYAEKDYTIPSPEKVVLNTQPLTEFSEEELQTEIDITNMHHLKYYGELLQEYFLIKGSYPFQGSYDKPVMVHISAKEEDTFLDPDYENISFKDFIQEIESVVERDVPEYYDPFSISDGSLRGYLYIMEGMHFTLKAHLSGSYGFKEEEKNTLSISNLLIPYRKLFTVSYLKNSEEFTELLSRPLKMGENFSAFQTKNLYNTNNK